MAKTTNGTNGKAKRHNLSGADFMKVWEASDNAQHVAEVTGMSLTSVIARATKMRGRGLSLKHFVRKNRETSSNLDELQATLAKIRNVDVSVIKEEGQKLVQASQERRKNRQNQSSSEDSQNSVDAENTEKEREFEHELEELEDEVVRQGS